MSNKGSAMSHQGFGYEPEAQQQCTPIVDACAASTAGAVDPCNTPGATLGGARELSVGCLAPPALEGSLAPDANDNKDAKKETPDEDADIESDSASSDTSDTLSGNPGSTIGESVGAESDSDIKDSLRFNYEIMRGTSRPMTEDLVKTRQY